MAREGERLQIPSVARTVYDVSGAGDTVIAVLGLALAAGAPIEQAMQLANFAAGAVVAKLGTATASPEEILALLEPGDMSRPAFFGRLLSVDEAVAWREASARRGPDASSLPTAASICFTRATSNIWRGRGRRATR